MIYILAAILCVLLFGAWAYWRIGRELDEMEWEDE